MRRIIAQTSYLEIQIRTAPGITSWRLIGTMSWGAALGSLPATFSSFIGLIDLLMPEKTHCCSSRVHPDIRLSLDLRKLSGDCPRNLRASCARPRCGHDGNPSGELPSIPSEARRMKMSGLLCVATGGTGENSESGFGQFGLHVTTDSV